MVAEGRIDRDVIAELEKRGHDVKVVDDWSVGKAMGIRYDGDVISGGVSPRHQIAYALGW